MTEQSPNKLSRGAVGVAYVVFFVAAAAPLTAVVGVAPAAFAFGNGSGVPGTFILVGVLYLLFSVSGADGFASGAGERFGLPHRPSLLALIGAAGFGFAICVRSQRPKTPTSGAPFEE
jgi:hypothetical protein